MTRRQFAELPLAAARPSTDAVESVSERARKFHREHPVCDMLGLNLTHPRFLIDNIDLGRRNEDTCRGDFPKFRDWGMSVVMCKGGPKEYDGDFAALWRSQPEHRPGRDTEPLSLSLAFKNPTQLVLTAQPAFAQATARAALNFNSVAAVVLTNGGGGYLSPPQVIIAPPSSGTRITS